MKDFLNRELEVGDKVVFITPGYRDYSQGTIIRFTKCFVFVSYKTRHGSITEIKQWSNQLIKINNEI